MRRISFNFSTKDNLNLYGRAWLSSNSNIKGIVNLVHGIGEHSGRYEHVGKAFTQAGYHLAAFDLRGHGLSDGKKGFSPSWDHLLDDIDLFLAETKKQLSLDVPQFLYGHSLGANLVLTYGLQREQDLSGVIATGPSIKLAFEPPKYKLLLGKVLANILPSFSMSNELDTDALSRDKAVVKAYVDDVYVHNQISARLAMDLFASGQYISDQAENWHLPLLLMHGKDDRINLFTASQEFAERGNGFIDLILYEGSYHEIHNDFEKEKVTQDMVVWLDQKI